MKYSIRHNTKGYFQSGIIWIPTHATALLHAKKFDTIEEAESVANTLKSLDGKILPKLDIVVINPPQGEYSFERFVSVKEVWNT